MVRLETITIAGSFNLRKIYRIPNRKLHHCIQEEPPLKTKKPGIAPGVFSCLRYFIMG